VANPIPDRPATEDTPFTYQIPANTFTDVDGDNLTYTASALPPGLTFDPGTRTISGTPTTPGTTNITVTATDPSGATATDTFGLAVANTNDAPVVANEIADQTVDEDTAYSYTIPANTFTDVDGDNLTYTTSALPPGLTFDSASGTISGTPTIPGTTNITVTATDTTGASATDTFALAVNDVAEGGATQYVSANSVSLPAGSYDIAASDDGTRTYVILGNGSVQVFDTSGATPTSLGTTPNIGAGSNSSIAVSADGTRAYVTSPNTNRVYIIDSSSPGTPIAVDVGDQPTGIAVSDNGTRAFVTNSGGNTVTMIDAPSGANPTVTTTAITVGDGPYDVAVSADGKWAFVSNGSDGTVTVIDASGTTPVASAPVTVGASPREIKASDDGSTAIVWNTGDASVSVIKNSPSGWTASTIPGPFSTNSNEGYVAISDDGSRAFFTDHNGRLGVIDTSAGTPSATYINIPDEPHSLATNADGSVVHVVAHSSLYVVDTETATVTPVSLQADNFGSIAEAVAVSDDGTRVAFTDVYGNLTLATFTTPTTPSSM
jgi:DNA-binding beta-propeller fold protein YncE